MIGPLKLYEIISWYPYIKNDSPVMNTYIAENLDFSVVIIPESLNPPQ
jgi:hypothetical protein